MRRVMDSEPIDVVVSGSSAEMLSSEIASNLQGRAVEAVVYPFSFRESLRHAGLEPQHPITHWSSAERSRRLLLGNYVDSTVLRDVIERHAIRQPLALQWLVRQLLGNGGSGFSLNKLHGGLKSQGLAISREHLAELVLHLESAFLIRSVSVVGGSLRRGAEVGYLRTSGGFEVDFHAHFPDGQRTLIQVCADLSEPTTRQWELRALVEALEEPGAREARAIVISLDRRAPRQWRFQMQRPARCTWASTSSSS